MRTAYGREQMTRCPRRLEPLVPRDTSHDCLNVYPAHGGSVQIRDRERRKREKALGAVDICSRAEGVLDFSIRVRTLPHGKTTVLFLTQ